MKNSIYQKKKIMTFETLKEMRRNQKSKEETTITWKSNKNNMKIITLFSLCRFSQFSRVLKNITARFVKPVDLAKST